MTFTSLSFLFFFPAVVIIYNLVPQKFKVSYLLLVSYVFYALMQPVYLVLLLSVTLVTYGTTRWMGVIDDDEKKRKIQVLGIVLVLLPLFFFKYFNFVNNSIISLLGTLGITCSLPVIRWILPVGISFYTFMAIGYIVDVYNEEVEVERNVESVGLFLSFFPIVLSGPIERSGNMFPQLRNLQRSKPEDLTAGLKLMLWGYFMKLCVADRLGIYVDAVFGDTANHNGTSLLIASVLHPFRVYSDFAGYSLLAVGAARCMGIFVMENFHRPFFATSMSEFWQRWHISLIKWITDYIYTPLTFAFRKWGVWGIVIAILLAFFISGVWHGAASTYIAWGVIQGIYLSIEALTRKQRTNVESKYNLVGKWWYLFLSCSLVFVLFSFSQIFGHCANLSEAYHVIGKIFTDWGIPYLDKHTLLFSAIFLFILFLKDFRDEFLPDRLLLFDNKSSVVRIVSYYVFILIILEFGAHSQSFIYFHF